MPDSVRKVCDGKEEEVRQEDREAICASKNTLVVLARLQVNKAPRVISTARRANAFHDSNADLRLTHFFHDRPAPLFPRYCSDFLGARSKYLQERIHCQSLKHQTEWRMSHPRSSGSGLAMPSSLAILLSEAHRDCRPLRRPDGLLTDHLIPSPVQSKTPKLLLQSPDCRNPPTPLLACIRRLVQICENSLLCFKTWLGFETHWRSGVLSELVLM